MIGGSSAPRLPPRSRAVLRALAPEVCPPDVVELGLVDAVVDHAEATWRALPPPLRRLLVAATYVLDVAGRRRGGWGSVLDPVHGARRTVALLHAHGRLTRQLFRGIRDLLVIGYYEQPTVQARLGYDPAGWVAQVAVERRQRWADDIAAHEVLLRRPHPRPRGPGS